LAAFTNPIFTQGGPPAGSVRLSNNAYGNGMLTITFRLPNGSIVTYPIMGAATAAEMVAGGPPVAEQAPPSYAPQSAPIPVSARSPVLVGTKVTSQPPKPPILMVAENPITAKPVYETPVSAAPVNDRVPTTSAQSGSNPGPIPAVGIVSPQAGSPVVSSCTAAPKNSWGGLALIAGILIALWIFAGISLRRLL
jgi:hypothetical protein